MERSTRESEMHFSYLLSSPEQILIHANWQETGRSANLWFFTGPESARRRSRDLDMVQREELAPLIEKFTKSTRDEEIQIRGEHGRTLANLVGEAIKGPWDIATLIIPQWCGFWDYPGTKTAIALWFTPDEGYNVDLLYSREQGQKLIADMNWISGEDRKAKLERIEKWHPGRAMDNGRRISGPAARMMCVASIIAKARAQMKTKSN